MTVDKNLFLSLAKRYNASSAEEAEAVLQLKNQFPYSQVIHALAARVSKDHELESEEIDLQMAAVYSADRGVLKEILSSQSLVAPQEVEAIEEPVIVHQTASVDSGRPAPAVSELQRQPFELDPSIDLADQVMKDLQQLNAARHNFEMLFVEYAEVQATGKSAEVASEPIKVDGSVAKETSAKESSKSRRERIIEMARSIHATDGKSDKPTSDKHASKSQKTKQSGEKGNGTEELIKEIITTKQEIEVENPKQKEQIELINHFIKTQPSISNAKDRTPSPTGDLNPIKTGEFGDNIVSETLVEILVKQGKKDKAIEVLKKLIWKYPQKKAYFASQIEDLKK